jgi:hypothetical protein
VKIDVRTMDGSPMTAAHATTPLGPSLRIAPTFRATGVASDSSIETSIDAVYSSVHGRYRITASTHRGAGSDVEITPTVLRSVRLGELLRTAVPYAVAVDDDTLGRGTIVELVGSGRLIPEWMAATARQLGPSPDTLELVQLVYSVAALAAEPPARAVAAELLISERTATHWIGKARKAGLLVGITYTAGRRPGHD